MSQIYLEKVRISFPHLQKPVTMIGSNPVKPQLNATFLVSPDSDNWKKLQTAITELAKDRWKDEYSVILKNIIMPDKKTRSFGDGEEQKDPKNNYEVRNGYAGMKWVSAKCHLESDDFLIYDSFGKSVSFKSDSTRYQEEVIKIYGGCYVNVVLKPYIPKDRKTINFTMKAVQFAAPGEKFGNSEEDVEKHFKPLDIEAPIFESEGINFDF